MVYELTCGRPSAAEIGHLRRKKIVADRMHQKSSNENPPKKVQLPAEINKIK